MSEKNKQQDPVKALRESNLTAAQEHFVETLKALGVETYMVAFALGEQVGEQGEYQWAGNAVLLKNFLCSFMALLTPLHFQEVMAHLRTDPAFAGQRGDKSHAEDAKLPMPGKWMN